MQKFYFLTILSVLMAGFVVSTKKRLSIYQIDQPLVWKNIFLIPKRFFVDVHHVVGREKSSSYMHIFVAGGFVLGTIILAIIVISPDLSWLGVLPLIMMVVGIVFLKQRRKGELKAQRSNGEYLELPYIFSILLLSISVLVVWGENFGLINLVAFALALITSYLVAFSGYLDKPLKHIVSGSLNLAFHPRELRFTQEYTAVASSNIGDINQLGVKTFADFTWQQKLNFDACIECGRCQKMCPAFAAGQPLNPKKLIQDLLISGTYGSDKNYAGIGHPNIKGEHSIKKGKGIIGNVIDGDILWSCTTCRACVYECPMMVEHVDAIVDLRRHQTMALGALPAKSAEVLDILRHTKTLSNKALNARTFWATDLEIEPISIAKPVDILLWSGEAGFELSNQKTLRQLVKIIKHTNLSLAILEFENDCGDLARRLGDEALFQHIAKDNIEKLQQYDFKLLLTIDPHVLQSIKNEYPQFGGNFKVQHHTEFLAKLVADKKLTINKLTQTVSYHDPCYLGRYNNVIDEPRKLLSALGVTINEMTHNKKKSRCCGWGGGSAFSDIAGETRIADMRVAEAKADTIVVACPNCKTMLEGVVEPRPEIVDIADLVYQAMQVG